VGFGVHSHKRVSSQGCHCGPLARRVFGALRGHVAAQRWRQLHTHGCFRVVRATFGRFRGACTHVPLVAVLIGHFRRRAVRIGSRGGRAGGCAYRFCVCGARAAATDAEIKRTAAVDNALVPKHSHDFA
jgi:hypothetical protein